MTIADVSVVIPYYEAADCIDRCLLSVASQTVRVREVIVVDDGSRLAFSVPDGLPRGLAADITTIRLERNMGAAAARNAGVRRAQGKYIAFLDADDVWMPEKIEIQHGLMQARGWTMSAHDYTFVRRPEDDAASGDPELRPVRRMDFVFGNPFFTPTVMVLREGFKLFDEAFRRTDDYKAWLENFEPGATFFIKRKLASGFKPPIGHSGLTGSVLMMHRSFIRVLASLHAEGKVSIPFYLATTAVEYLKLPLRCLRIALARLATRP